MEVKQIKRNVVNPFQYIQNNILWFISHNIYPFSFVGNKTAPASKTSERKFNILEVV